MIEVSGLCKRYGAIEILKGLDLRVESGTTAAIIGPSGSGKSTFLRCLNGLETFASGRIAIEGVELDGCTPPRERALRLAQIRRRVGMVFQDFNLFPHRTALENVVEGPIHVLGEDRRRARERGRRLLARVGLADRLCAYPRELSGGQQQRVAIARALAMSPRAILFDEPTSALDPRSTAEVLDVMAELAADGLTLVVVTHAMAFARKIASVVHVFADGCVAESGPPDQVFGQPCQEATRRLLAEFQAA